MDGYLLSQCLKGHLCEIGAQHVAQSSEMDLIVQLILKKQKSHHDLILL